MKRNSEMNVNVVTGERDGAVGIALGRDADHLKAGGPHESRGKNL
jgi:ribosomal protein S5